MSRFGLVLILIVLLSGVSLAQTHTISGKVTDVDTKEPLVGANVFIEGTSIGAATNNDGSFIIRNVPRGEQTLAASFAGYFKHSIKLNISGNITQDFTLKQRVIENSEVVVTATRAKDRETPVAFSNMDRESIEEKYDLQDVPMLLSEEPGVYSYSETGAGIGYTYLRVRGFDQSRIGVMLNGIPLNDPESHQVYWIDLADFGENINDLQIQRGVGNSLYGSAAIGGSVNVVTTNFSNERKISLSTGYGSYNTKKLSLGMSSGLIDDKYAIYGRFSELQSDGYRDEAWVELWSYFFSAVRFDDKWTNKINVYGGPELTHLTYEGVTRDHLDGKITGDKDVDRKANPLSGPDEVDNTFQPHYELHTEYAYSDKVLFTNAVYYTGARGYYRNFKNRRDLFEYNLDSFTTTDPTPFLGFADFKDVDEFGNYKLKSTDLERKRWIDNKQYGIIPRMSITHNKGEFFAGAEVRLHNAAHWGEVLYVPVPVPGFKPGHKYYDYNVDKDTYSVFAHENYALTDKLNLMADAQVTYHKYSIFDDKRNNVEFDVDYKFFTPRVGLNYNATAKLNFFGNFSIAQREPTFRSIYDAQYAYSTPLFNDNNYDDPLVKPEKMFDYETGFSYLTNKFTSKINFYYMDFRDELVRWGGQVDEEGIAISGNAKKSYHAGIEIESAYQMIPELAFKFNAALSKNEFKKHSEFANDWSTWPPGVIENNYDGNTIGGFPSTIINGTSLFSKNGFTARLNYQFIGKQFLDNSENERKNPGLHNQAGYVDKVIDAYSLLNLRLSYNIAKFSDIKGMRLGLSIYNLLDEEYETAGYIDGAPLWIPGAYRNYFLSLKIDM